MEALRKAGLILALAALVAGPITAQDTEEAAEGGDETREESVDTVQDVIVVTASRTEQKLHEVPAAITVMTAEQLEEIPADDYGDFLRNVPGVNVSQLGARDINVTSRGSTNTLAASQLVLMDNRTLYLDFFGFVMWDFVPLDAKEIKQIEVVNGPGSAVWGANAMTGVINLITKSPKEMTGTSVTLGAGELGTTYGSITHAGVNAGGNVGYKLTGSYYTQDDAYDRPTGVIPGTVGPTNPGGTRYPGFQNKGTEQPKANFRVDYDKSMDTTYSFSGGYAGTDGIIHSGIGPFDISTGSQMSFAKFDWTKRAARVTFFVNFLDGDALNLLTVGPTGQPIAFDFESQTYNLDFGDTRVAGENHIFTYGGTVRQNDFDLSIAPRGDERQEYGVFIQDEILIGDNVRWLIGARWDDIDPIGGVFSPRTSLLISPRPNHTFRLSFNRAFRAPSMINNFLDVTTINQALIPPFPPLIPAPFVLTFPTRAVGNPLLTEERLDAFEIGYVGTYDNGVTFTLSVYRNEQTDSVDFFTRDYYDSFNPPPGWPLPGIIPTPFGPVGTVPPETFPAALSYRNIGEIVDQGAEIGLQGRPSATWSYFLNYSYQDEPEVSGIDQVRLPNGTIRDGVNSPPQNRFNFGFAWDNGSWFFNGNGNWVDEAFWTDVLDARFWGPTDSYSIFNLGCGVRLNDERVTISIQAQNVADEEVQQHIFGDIISRKVSGQVLFRF